MLKEALKMQQRVNKLTKQVEALATRGRHRGGHGLAVEVSRVAQRRTIDRRYGFALVGAIVGAIVGGGIDQGVSAFVVDAEGARASTGATLENGAEAPRISGGVLENKLWWVLTGGLRALGAAGRGPPRADPRGAARRARTTTVAAGGPRRGHRRRWCRGEKLRINL